ncbi:adenylosuccinate synthetase [Candidatus Woesearchaeota archaeon]|nr:adenylosuccinate synthetase [Candidatus Woesearchaeota archaeon]
MITLEDCVVRFGHIKRLEHLPRIGELDIAVNRRYEEATIEDRFYPIVEDNDILIVAGAFFGDEGKGKTIDAVVQHPDIKLLISANSGQNAGHTIYYRNEKGELKKVILHAVPSGVAAEGVDSLINSECVADIVTLVDRELKELDEAGISTDRLYIDNIHLVAPYHKIMDFVGKPPNSSTLQGIWPVHASKAAKTSIRLDDLDLPDDALRKKIEKDMVLYNGLLKEKGISEADVIKRFDDHNSLSKNKIPEHVYNFLKADDKVQFLMDMYREYAKKLPKRGDATTMINRTLEAGGKIGIECKQSEYLSNAEKTHFSSATSADTTAFGTLAATGINISKYRVAVVNVLKVPPSRVGPGGNPAGFVHQRWFSDQKIETLDQLQGVCEDWRSIEKAYFDSVDTNGTLLPATYTDTDGRVYAAGAAMAISQSRKYGECGATTGKPRILGILDLVAHAHVNRKQGPYLSINALDRYDDCDRVGLVVAYVYFNPSGETAKCNDIEYQNGDVILPGMVMPTENVLKQCKPIIKVLDGWNGNPLAAGKRQKGAPLPEQVQNFIGHVEYHTGAEVLSVGVGPRTEDIIYIDRQRTPFEKKVRRLFRGTARKMRQYAGMIERLAA